MFDLDDTIVQAGSYVSPRVLTALREAREAGWVLSISSGRPRCMLDATILGAGVMDYCVCSNGATVYRLTDDALVASKTMSRDDARMCRELASRYGAAWNAFIDDDAYFEWRGASYMLMGRTGALARASRNGTSQCGRSAGVVRRLFWSFGRGFRFVWRMASNCRQHQVMSVARRIDAATDGVQKLGCVFSDAGRCDAARDAIRSCGRFEVVQMGDCELEITAKGVDKGAGARVLLEHLGMRESQAIAFGDGGNDLPLASAVGRFVAVGNAEPHVKEAADEVCPPVTEDGVARWIECMLGKSRYEGGERLLTEPAEDVWS